MAEITQETVEEYLADIEYSVIADFGGDSLEEVLKIARADMKPFVTNSQRTQQFLRENFGRNMTEITSSTRREVSKSLNEGIRLGEDYSGLSKRLKSSFDHLSRSRRNTIATTEVGGAANFAIDEGYRQSGLVSKRRWVTTFLRSRDTHMNLSGEERGMDEAFSTINGSAMYPGSFGVASEDINCRCRTVAAKFTSDETTEDVTLRKDPATGELTRGGKPIIPVTPEPIPVPKPRVGKERPAGVPVSAALKAPSRGHFRDASIHAMRAVDKVHGDGNLPDLPIKTGKMSTRQGHFKYRATGDQQPIEIKMSTQFTAEAEHTLIHEIGHFLDHNGFNTAAERGGKQMASTFRDTPAWKRWLSSVKDSAAIKKLQYQRNNLPVRDYRSFSQTASKKMYDNYLDVNEAWARSYAQYITEKSGDAVLKKQLNEILKDDFYGASQWAASDFAPIREAMDDLFKEKGWIE